MFAFYSEFGLKDKKECALGNFLFGLVFYLFMILGGLCVICVNVYDHWSCVLCVYAQWVGFVLYVLMFMGGEAGVWPWF